MVLRALLVLTLFLSAMRAAADPEVAVAVVSSGEAFVIDVSFVAPVEQRIAWDVLVDFDHMAGIVHNLTSSRVVSRDGNMLVIRQQGVARYGVFSYEFESEREIRLEPTTRILARSLGGTEKRMTSEARLQATEQGRGVQVRYHAEAVSDSWFVRTFGAPFLRHEVGEQFRYMLAEMKRRQAETARQ